MAPAASHRNRSRRTTACLRAKRRCRNRQMHRRRMRRADRWSASRQIGGHQRRRTTQEGQRRSAHALIAERQQMRQQVPIAVDQQLHRVAAAGGRLPGRMQAARDKLAQGLPGLATFRDRQHGVPAGHAPAAWRAVPGERRRIRADHAALCKREATRMMVSTAKFRCTLSYNCHVFCCHLGFGGSGGATPSGTPNSCAFNVSATIA